VTRAAKNGRRSPSRGQYQRFNSAAGPAAGHRRWLAATAAAVTTAGDSKYRDRAACRTRGKNDIEMRHSARADRTSGSPWTISAPAIPSLLLQCFPFDKIKIVGRASRTSRKHRLAQYREGGAALANGMGYDGTAGRASTNSEQIRGLQPKAAPEMRDTCGQQAAAQPRSSGGFLFGREPRKAPSLVRG